MTENVKKIFRIFCIYTTFAERKEMALDYSNSDINTVEFEIFKLEIGKCILGCEQDLLRGDPDWIITPISWTLENCINDFADLMQLDLNQDERAELLYYLSCFNEEEQIDIFIKEGLVNEDYYSEHSN